MRELNYSEMEHVNGGWWVAIAAVAAAGAWAWENRADLMEVGDAASAKNSQLNSEH